MRHLHILGIGGCFMSGIAILAKELGYTVTGCDSEYYAPTKGLLLNNKIDCYKGFACNSAANEADIIIVGNVIKRGMPIIEKILNSKKTYISGPEWLYKNILNSYSVVAISGTHGKTTTTTMLSFLLEQTGHNPGFLIGGIPSSWKTNSKLGKGKWFVIEADEYDTAFFDKRPKFIHYHPEIAILNNLEFDHADIYENLEAIEKQFHFYLKTIPEKGLVLKQGSDAALTRVVNKGIYSKLEEFSLGGSVWRAKLLDPIGTEFQIFYKNNLLAKIKWNLIGKFNVENALAAFAASYHIGVDVQEAAKALSLFQGPKRRLEVLWSKNNITLYDDFAHHPTAILKTLETLKLSGRHKRLLVIIEFASYTMKMGLHKLTKSLEAADLVFFLQPSNFDLSILLKKLTATYFVFENTNLIMEKVNTCVKAGDGIIIMSNRDFNGIHMKIMDNLENRFCFM